MKVPEQHLCDICKTELGLEDYYNQPIKYNLKTIFDSQNIVKSPQKTNYNSAEVDLCKAHYEWYMEHLPFVGKTISNSPYTKDGIDIEFSINVPTEEDLSRYYEARKSIEDDFNLIKQPTNSDFNRLHQEVHEIWLEFNDLDFYNSLEDSHD